MFQNKFQPAEFSYTRLSHRYITADFEFTFSTNVKFIRTPSICVLYVILLGLFSQCCCHYPTKFCRQCKQFIITYKRQPNCQNHIASKYTKAISSRMPRHPFMWWYSNAFPEWMNPLHASVTLTWLHPMLGMLVLYGTTYKEIYWKSPRIMLGYCFHIFITEIGFAWSLIS